MKPTNNQVLSTQERVSKICWLPELADSNYDSLNLVNQLVFDAVHSNYFLSILYLLHIHIHKISAALQLIAANLPVQMAEIPTTAKKNTYYCEQYCINRGSG